MEQIYTPKQDYKVFVRTITYNQANYIADNLNGVAMQQTDFPFVHFVIDDCSTDGEQEVIKRWLYEHCDMANAEYKELELANVILASNKTNRNCHHAIYLLKRNLWKEPELKANLYTPWRELSQYEAICEGDDYWTDSLKIQKQVAALEANPEIDICTHCADVVKDDEIIRQVAPKCDNMIIPVEEVIAGDGGFVATNSIMYRISALKHVLPFYLEKTFDYTVQIQFSLRGGMLYLTDNMCTYRRGDGDSWSDIAYSQPDVYSNYARDVIHMLQTLDQNTNRAYHDVIQNKIISYRYIIAGINHDISLLTNKDFTQLRKEMSLKDKLKYFVKCIYR